MSLEQDCSQSISQRLPDTCPISQTDLSQLTWGTQNGQKPWGRLYSTKPELPSIELIKDEYTIGRGPTCDLSVKIEANSPKREICRIHGAISKMHFKIRRTNISTPDYEDFIVHLDDFSSNGTFVNGRKIGKGNSVILENNNEISICFSYYKAFIYISSSLDSEVKAYPEEVKMNYAISRVLGSGSFGQVRLVFEKTSGKALAMKVIQKKRLCNDARHLYDPVRTQREVDVLKSLSNVFIIKFVNVIDSVNHMFILTEYMEGGELFDRVKHGPLLESDAKLYFFQLSMAVRYLHENDIIHRFFTLKDFWALTPRQILILPKRFANSSAVGVVSGPEKLKPKSLSILKTSAKDSNLSIPQWDIKLENILLSSREPESLIKLSDFGFSKFLDQESVMMTFCGTPLYIAPEILKNKGRAGSYDKKVDVWSMGVVLFICLSGAPPFESSGGQQLTEQILKGKYSFSNRYWGRVSRKALYLIRRMLTVNPEIRISTEEVLGHAWLQDKSVSMRVNRLLKNIPTTQRNESDDEVDSDVENSRNFKRARFEN